ncbi:MAG: hypothetical protein LBC83_05885 [Oscillospiraceae bacterium]|nr:hypothetical protein [Oscillospiraceae bacterium]
MRLKKQTAPSPASGENEPEQGALLRLHWRKVFFACAAAVLTLWMLGVLGDSIIRKGGGLQTEIAEPTAFPLLIETEMTFVRNEIPLLGTAGGRLVPLVAVGERVAVGQSYAAACSGEQDAATLLRMQSLEQRLQWLEESGKATNYHAVNVQELSKQVDEAYTALLQAYDARDSAAISLARETFLYRSTGLEAALGETLDFSTEIAAAQEELASLRAADIEAKVTELKTSAAGYYYPQADGREAVLTPEKLMNLTPESWEALRTGTASPMQAQGRIITDFRWYAVTVLPAEDARQLNEGSSYTVEFPLEAARTLTMRVESVRQGKAGAAAVVFSAEKKEDALLQLRGARASITLDVHKGLQIPTTALRVREGGEGLRRRSFTGVYVLAAGQPVLREVEVLYQSDADGVAIVAWDVENKNRALEGDRVILRGAISGFARQEDGSLLVVGKHLRLTAQDTHALSPIEEGKAITKTTYSAPVYDIVTLRAAKTLSFKKDGEDLIVTGTEMSFKEGRGTGIKIYDHVVVKGRVPENAG